MKKDKIDENNKLIIELYEKLADWWQNLPSNFCDTIIAEIIDK